ncbi:MAG: T9SS type A sorting domain-containing protein [Ignavibacteria bacterium]|nr:T9SS type A sorting domain-containing protein [Ignavibacteria bacterium]
MYYLCPTCPVGQDNFAASNETTESPKEYSLSNYPNPFNPTTKINYELPASRGERVTNYVSLKVYDVLGNEIAILVKEKQNAGRYSVNFNGANLSSGIYFYRFESNGIVLTGRMLLIK